MSDRIAVVTGGSGGIGHAIATSLAERGFDVAVTGRDRARLDAACASILDKGRRASAHTVDHREPDAAARLAREVETELGPPRILINNAGTAPTARFEATSDGMLDEVLDLHVRTPFRLTRELLPAMRERGSGCIVQLASTAGLRGFPFTSAYTAAKHAMVGMTRALAQELRGTAVRTYAVCPGFVDTEITRRAANGIAARGKQTVDEALAAMAAMNHIGRMHSAVEIGDAVAELCIERPDGCVLDLDRDPPAFVD